MFEDALRGLVLAEAEFDSAEHATSLVLPSYISKEVSNDIRFTGGRLVRGTRQDIQSWTSEYGVHIP